MNADCLIYKNKLTSFLEEEGAFTQLKISKDIFLKDVDFYIERNYQMSGQPEFLEEDLDLFLQDCCKKTQLEEMNTSLFKLMSLDLVEMTVDEDGIKYSITKKGNEIVNKIKKENQNEKK